MKTIATIASAVLAIAIASCSKEKAVSPGSAKAPADYPLTTCVVSGEELGSMGAPVVYDHEGTTVKFCCKSCIPKFEKDPTTYLAKLKK